MKAVGFMMFGGVSTDWSEEGFQVSGGCKGCGFYRGVWHPG